MKTIIAGSRAVTSLEAVRKAVQLAGIRVTEVVSGRASGVDRLGEDWARENNVPVAEFPADWKRYAKRAGYLRNRRMGEYAEALIAVWDGQSRGTGHMINIANELGLVVKVFLFDESTGELREHNHSPKNGSTLPFPALAKPGAGP